MKYTAQEIRDVFSKVPRSDPWESDAVESLLEALAEMTKRSEELHEELAEVKKYNETIYREFVEAQAALGIHRENYLTVAKQRDQAIKELEAAHENGGRIGAKLAHAIAREGRLADALKDIAEFGCRHDINPTGCFHPCGHFEVWEGRGGWSAYIRSMDDGVRERAQAALSDSSKGSDAG